jgi:mannitol/fructose-specific phosphotransferase system IIA component (Ntr-type)
MLDVAGAAGTRLFIAMTSNSEVNQLAADMASNLFAVPEVQVLREQVDGSNTPSGSVTLFGGACPQSLWNSRITQRETRVERILIQEDEPAVSFFAALGDLKVALPLVVERKGRKLLADSVDELKAGDCLVVLEHAPEKRLSGDRFEELVKQAPVLDIKEALEAEDFFRLVSGILADKVGQGADHIYDLLVQRERDSSTVIVPGVAIPHIMIEGEGITELVVARSRAGVSFWAADSDARIIFVIVGTRDERKFHLRILSAIAQLFQDPSFEERWMDVVTSEELRQVVLSTERRRF